MDQQVHCPKCNSTQIAAQKKGFSAGKAIAGAVTVGGIGLLAGLHGSSNVEITCLACGHKWSPLVLKKENERKAAEVEIRNFTQWKNEFYEYYKLRNFEQAAQIYNLRFPFTSDVSDVHIAYKRQRKNDRDMMLIRTVLVVVFFGFMILMIKIIA